MEFSRVLKRKRSKRACINCRERKVKCDTFDPCGACKRAGIECKFHLSGQAKRRPVDSCTRCRPVMPASALTLVAHHVCAGKIQRPLTFAGECISARELGFIAAYDRYVNTFLPMIPPQMYQNGFPNFGIIPHDSLSHGIRAATWAATALGAVLSGQAVAEEYFKVAHNHLRECFDAPHVEVLSAHIAMCQLAFALGRKAQFVTYAGFADVLAAELKDVMSPELKACMSHIASHIAGYTEEKIRFSATCVDDLKKLAELALNVQLLYVIDYGNNALYEHMKDSCKPIEERRNHARAVVRFIEPLSARLNEIGNDSNPMGRFFCNALLTSVLPYIGRSGECMQLVLQNLALLTKQPCILAIQCVWHVSAMMAKRLAARGFPVLAAQFEMLLRQHVAYAHDPELYETLMIRTKNRSFESDAQPALITWVSDVSSGCQSPCLSCRTDDGSPFGCGDDEQNSASVPSTPEILPQDYDMFLAVLLDAAV